MAEVIGEEDVETEPLHDQKLDRESQDVTDIESRRDRRDRGNGDLATVDER